MRWGWIDFGPIYHERIRAGTLRTMESVSRHTMPDFVEGMNSSGKILSIGRKKADSGCELKGTEAGMLNDTLPLMARLSIHTNTPDIVEGMNSGHRSLLDGCGINVSEGTEAETLNETSPLMASVSLCTTPDIAERIDSGDLNVLQGNSGGEMKGNEAETSNESPQVSLQKGPLQAFDRGTAVRMLTAYLKDFEGLINAVLDDRIKRNMKIVLENYRKVLKDLNDTNKREPNGQLTLEERIIVRRMLRDYQSALEDSLEVEGSSIAAIDHQSTPSMTLGKNDEISLSSMRLDDMVQSLWNCGRIPVDGGNKSDIEIPPVRLQDGPLRRESVVIMLTDYLKDMETWTAQVLDSVIDTPPECRKMMQKRLEIFQKSLKDLTDANQLTVAETVIVRRMLKDYHSALEDSLQVESSLGGTNDLKTPGQRMVLQDHQVGLVKQIQEVKDCEMALSSLRFDDRVQSQGNSERVPTEGGEMLEIEAKFPIMLGMLGAELKVCEASVEELSSNPLHQLTVYKAQCTHLVSTLSSHTHKRFPLYHHTLQTLLNQKFQEIKFVARRDWLIAVAFCIQSLVEVERTFRLTAELVSTCGNPEWWKPALKMSNGPPDPRIPRWSTFTVALRQCEWALDVVELSFHVLMTLLNSKVDFNWKDAVIFKWSVEERRIMPQITAKSGTIDHKDDKDKIDILQVAQDLEAEDRSKLLEKIQLFSVKRKNWPLRPDKIAKFLEKKLRGPTADVSYLPFQSFEIDLFELEFEYYIGKGVSGMVAEYKWLGETVAVKSVKAPGLGRSKLQDEAATLQGRNNFEDEAAVLATVQHPNVVRLLGAAFQEEKHIGMLVMELMEHDLRTLIDKRRQHHAQPFPLIVAIDIMIQIAEAMHYLFAHRVLHRDLKAKNILVNRCKLPPRVQVSASDLQSFPDLAQLLCVEEYYIVKLGDFGLAKSRSMTSNCTTLNVGTKHWRAPELYSVVDADYRWPADIYSFGMTCYEILTGGIPFETDPLHTILDKILRGERPSLVGKAPPTLAQLIEKCWDTKPEKRPKISEIIKQLWRCKVEVTFGSIQSLHMGKVSEEQEEQAS